jgi:hypothetical protein
MSLSSTPALDLSGAVFCLDYRGCGLSRDGGNHGGRVTRCCRHAEAIPPGSTQGRRGDPHLYLRLSSDH